MGATLELRCAGFSLQWLLLWSTGSRALTSVVSAHRLQGAGSVVVGVGLVAPRHVGSSQTRDGTGVPCIARQILKLWTTREAQTHGLLIGITHRVSGLEAQVLCVSAQKEFSKKQSDK